MPKPDYDPANSLIFFENNRKRPGKNDPEFTGTLTDADGVEHWLSIWPKTKRDTKETFWTGNFRKKEARNDGPEARPPARSTGSSMGRRVDNAEDLP